MREALHPIGAVAPDSSLYGVVDFFCGCGGASYGFLEAAQEGAPLRIVAGIDNDPYCCATYERMLGRKAHQLDILDLVNEDGLDLLATEWALEAFRGSILIGCAPCQGFAAHRKAVEGTDQRRNLFVAFCKAVRRLQPEAVLIENVPDLFSKRHWPFFLEGSTLLRDAGYIVRSRIYNFASFGLPQERFRAVILAMRQPFDMPTPLLGDREFRTVGETIASLPPLQAGECSLEDEMHLVSKHRPETVELLSKVPVDGGNRPVGVGPECLDRARRQYGGYTDVYGRLAWSRPAVTITARCRTPSCGRFAHPEQNRGLSVREAALLQGFPANYYFEGPFDDKYKQIGNAVPPLVARVLGWHLVRCLESPKREMSDLELDVREPVGPGFAVTINGIKKLRKVAS